MDPLDDFQFKPITKGLGFHKKAEKPAPLKRASSIEDNDLELLPPLPRREFGSKATSSANNISIPTLNIEESEPTESTPTVDQILKTIQSKRKLDFTKDKTTSKNKILNTPVAAKYKSSAIDASASLLDLMLLIAAQLTGLIILLVVTKVDLFANLYNPDDQYMIYAGLGLMFVGFTWIYLVTCRAFMGYTPGEWVFDQRLGIPEQSQKLSYIPLVAVRSLLVIATGFVLFPILSLLFNRDVLGRMMKLELVRKA